MGAQSESSCESNQLVLDTKTILIYVLQSVCQICSHYMHALVLKCLNDILIEIKLFFEFQMADPGRYLQCVRTLRDYAGKGCWEAQVCD